MNHVTVTVEERKNKLTDKLSTQYSLNHISLEEYERLISYSQNIETEKELVILEKIIEGHCKTNEPKPASTDNFPKNHFSILSSKKTSGPITTGNYMAILADHKIIITEDDLINDETLLNFMVVLGDVVIHVPETVSVISNAVPILADVSVDSRVKNTDSGKRLIITGSVILGDIKVKVKKD